MESRPFSLTHGERGRLSRHCSFETRNGILLGGGDSLPRMRLLQCSVWTALGRRSRCLVTLSAVVALYGCGTPIYGYVGFLTVGKIMDAFSIPFFHPNAAVADRFARNFGVLMQGDTPRGVIRLNGSPPLPSVMFRQRRACPEIVTEISATGADTRWLVPRGSTLSIWITTAVSGAGAGRIAGVAISFPG